MNNRSGQSSVKKIKHHRNILTEAQFDVAWTKAFDDINKIFDQEKALRDAKEKALKDAKDAKEKALKDAEAAEEKALKDAEVKKAADKKAAFDSFSNNAMLYSMIIGLILILIYIIQMILYIRMILVEYHTSIIYPLSKSNLILILIAILIIFGLISYVFYKYKNLTQDKMSRIFYGSLVSILALLIAIDTLFIWFKFGLYIVIQQYNPIRSISELMVYIIITISLMLIMQWYNGELKMYIPW